jgi:preprotein translocase subunit SecE
MATEEDLKKAEAEAAPDDEASESGEAAPLDTLEVASPEGDESVVVGPAGDVEMPVQLGYARYVYAAYMAAALLASFLIAKVGEGAWSRLEQWKAEIGPPRDEILFPLSGLIGCAIAVYYWRKPEANRYVREVAEELSKVTWPSREEVKNSTVVVVLTTLFATLFFALMDWFWRIVTDRIYTFGS